MSNDIDLEKIAKSIGQTGDGFLSVRLAIEEIVGKQNLSAMVDYYINEGMYESIGSCESIESIGSGLLN